MRLGPTGERLLTLALHGHLLSPVSTRETDALAYLQDGLGL